MGLRDYLKIFRSHLLLIVIIVVVGVGVALAVVMQKNAGFDTSVTYTINRVNVQETTDYKYDQYYALNAVDLFARTVVGWLNAPSLVEDIFAGAGIATPFKNLRDEAKFFAGRKIATQVVEVRFNYGDENDAKKLVEGMNQVVQREVNKLNEQTKNESYFTISASEPVIVPGAEPVALVGVVSLAVSLFIALNLALLLDYLKRNP